MYNADTTLEIVTCIGAKDGSRTVQLKNDWVTIKEVAKMCRMDYKKGGGCPAGQFVSCPFEYEPYKRRHVGERPIACETVTVDDWVELLTILEKEVK